MLLVEYQNLVPYSAGTIQMVPGRTGYEPSYRRDDPEETGLMQMSREVRYHRSKLLDEKYETTYNENCRLTSPGTSDVGSFIDIYA